MQEIPAPVTVNILSKMCRVHGYSEENLKYKQVKRDLSSSECPVNMCTPRRLYVFKKLTEEGSENFHVQSVTAGELPNFFGGPFQLIKFLLSKSCDLRN